MTLPRFMFTVKTIASTVLHRREELPLQHEGHNIHDDFAVTILKNSNTAGHVPRDISWYFLQKSGSEMTCIVYVNGDYSASERRSEVAHVYSRRRSPGGVITSQTTLCRNLGGKEEGGLYSKGAY